MKTLARLWLCFVALGCASPTLAQKPVIAFDEGHYNVRTLQNEYMALGDLASSLGFVDRPHVGPFSAVSLEGVHVLIACCARATDTGPLADRGRPAHTEEELDALERWVRNGGALLIAIDHYPIGGANEGLTARFGVDVVNGRTEDDTIREAAVADALVFDRSRNGIADHPITCGDGTSERIDRVGTWGGASLNLPPGAAPLLHFSENAYNTFPDDQYTTTTPAPGRLQGLAMLHGRGRVVILGEMSVLYNYRHSTLQNRQFAANVLRWLAGELTAETSNCRNH